MIRGVVWVSLYHLWVRHGCISSVPSSSYKPTCRSLFLSVDPSPQALTSIHISRPRSSSTISFLIQGSYPLHRNSVYSLLILLILPQMPSRRFFHPDQKAWLHARIKEGQQALANESLRMAWKNKTANDFIAKFLPQNVAVADVSQYEEHKKDITRVSLVHTCINVQPEGRVHSCCV